ncbi:hypothetical protein [Klebsiella pneumoniae]|uniref:hypothetical protein n=1 Tax=Klebsiella pneumoniae TaxID=573 RepID=UPI001D1869E7|nr:hypothetical protein [Klebsiella pneumoniae]
MITTRRMLMLYACLVPVALTGCDLADYFPNVPQPVPVISPGYQVDIDGHPVRISGLMTARGIKMKPGTQLRKMRKAALCCLQSVPR